ncbi:MAG: hypothetical protein ACOCXQ_04670 [Patescibacteria group bacterium]
MAQKNHIEKLEQIISDYLLDSLEQGNLSTERASEIARGTLKLLPEDAPINPTEVTDKLSSQYPELQPLLETEQQINAVLDQLSQAIR